jgi:hypothetical protein
VSSVEYLTRHCFVEQPFQRAIALAPKIGDQTHPIDVHVDAEGGGGRMVAEAALLPANLRESQAASAEFARHRHGEVAGVLQIGEIFVEEPIVPVVAGAAFREAVQQLVG